MNNKKIGSDFEAVMCRFLQRNGFWVHFISPDKIGAQPFDIIAVKNGIPLALDCKTSVSHIFRITRLEENQRYAFDKWMMCGNPEPYIVVLYNDVIHFVPYDLLKKNKKVDLLVGSYGMPSIYNAEGVDEDNSQ